jgi:hypothetical protein
MPWLSQNSECVPDGLIFAPPNSPSLHLSIDTFVKIKNPKQGLSLNNFLDYNNYEQYCDYVDLGVYIIHKIFEKHEYTEFITKFVFNLTDYLLFKSSTLGKVESMFDLRNITRIVRTDFMFIPVDILEEIIYRFWQGDYNM